MKKIKVGIFGVGRGMDLAKDFMLLGADIVAICDFNEERLEEATKKVGVGKLLSCPGSSVNRYRRFRISW